VTESQIPVIFTINYAFLSGQMYVALSRYTDPAIKAEQIECQLPRRLYPINERKSSV